MQSPARFLILNTQERDDFLPRHPTSAEVAAVAPAQRPTPPEELQKTAGRLIGFSAGKGVQLTLPSPLEFPSPSSLSGYALTSATGEVLAFGVSCGAEAADPDGLSFIERIYFAATDAGTAAPRCAIPRHELCPAVFPREAPWICVGYNPALKLTLGAEGMRLWTDLLADLCKARLP